jgi:DNA-binding CsgD family transcriptional regulator
MAWRKFIASAVVGVAGFSLNELLHPYGLFETTFFVLSTTILVVFPVIMAENRCAEIRQVTYMTNRLSHRDLEVCSCALRELYVESSLQEFPDRLLPLLARLIPTGHVSYNDFDPRHNRFVIRIHPERAEAQKLLPQFTAHFPTHPLHERFQRRGVVLNKISDVATLRQFKETAIYQEYYRALDTRHQLVLFLPRQEDSRVGLALNRDAKDFSERDRSVLAFLSPHIAQAWRNASIADAMSVKLDTIGEGLDTMRRAVILAGGDGQIHWQSPLVREWLREFFSDEFTPERLPSSMANWLNRIEKLPPAGRPIFSEFQTPTRKDSRLLIYCGKAISGEYVLALIRERMTVDAAAAQSYGLTPREAEILFWISEAKTRPEIGAILGISWRTIGKHMEHLFAKLGVENRLEAQRFGLELRRM